MKYVIKCVKQLHSHHNVATTHHNVATRLIIVVIWHSFIHKVAALTEANMAFANIVK